MVSLLQHSYIPKYLDSLLYIMPGKLISFLLNVGQYWIQGLVI